MLYRKKGSWSTSSSFRKGEFPMGLFSKAGRLILVVAACTLMCAPVGGAGDQSVIRWTEGMGTNLSEAEVFWDFMEVGAPLVLLPNRGGELDPREVKYGAWERL